jgi:hypothetical protein
MISDSKLKSFEQWHFWKIRVCRADVACNSVGFCKISISTKTDKTMYIPSTVIPCHLMTPQQNFKAVTLTADCYHAKSLLLHAAQKTIPLSPQTYRNILTMSTSLVLNSGLQIPYNISCMALNIPISCQEKILNTPLIPICSSSCVAMPSPSTLP